jgi:hypothetical protein
MSFSETRHPPFGIMREIMIAAIRASPIGAVATKIPFPSRGRRPEMVGSKAVKARLLLERLAPID